MTTTTSPAPDAQQEVGWRFLRSRRWIGYYALFVAFAVACVMLGNWQFDRRAEARAEIARIDANYDAPAVPLSVELPELDAYSDDAQKWKTVELRGEYVGEPYLARNRPGEQGVGVDVIHPFRTENGALFFVDRGWVPVDDDGAVPETLPLPADGAVTVEARLRASEPAVPGRTTHGRTVGSIDLPELARLADAEGSSYTAAYGMLVSESPEGEHGALPPRPERDEGPHLSYALQWYIFILIAAVGLGYAARQEYRHLNAGSDRVTRQDDRRAERRRRRGPSDADEEDALLDR